MDKLKNLTRNNIRTAIDDYFRHADSDHVYENISEEFVNCLAIDSINSKSELRELFSKSNGWNEQLQAIIINGTKTHNPDYFLVHNLANDILRPAKWDADCDKLNLIECAVCRIFKAICDSLGVSDNSAGSEFQRLFAQFADELSTRKIDFKLFISINPAHFLTMSNPKRDKRGSTMTSCHSFNSTDYE